MKGLGFGRFALAMGVAAALLAGCWGSQSSIGAPGALPQGRTIARQADRSGSRMLPEAKRDGALIYVVGGTSVYVVSYTRGTVVKTFNPGAFWGICSDKSGNVFIPIKGSILEYKHGGVAPVAKLQDAGELGYACSVDPLTGNLAVVNSGVSGDVAIYDNAAGKPKVFTDPSMQQYFACAYDNAGNLIVNGEGADGTTHLAELPMGSDTFQDLTLNEQLNMWDLHWDGQYVAASDEDDVYQISISGSDATVVGKTLLRSQKGVHRTFWIQDDVVLAPIGPGLSVIGLWKYPGGGNSVNRYSVAKKAYLRGVTVSVAPSR